MVELHAQPPDLPAALTALAGITLGDTSLDAVLQRTCEVAKTAIVGAEEVSVTLLAADGPRTVASSGPLAAQLDESQYAAGRGPCMAAAERGEPVVVADTRRDSDWPNYADAADALGVRASVSVPLRADKDVSAALNIYGSNPDQFDADSVNEAVELAHFAGIVLTNVDQYFRAKMHAEQMEGAMRTRAVIEQAKGIVMAQQRCTPEEAFDILVRLSQSTHRKLRDVAASVVEQIVEG
jgi:GAF domain-containing protein